ncbi:MAG: tyrosine-type recombinase/integrase, partial [Clostridiales bacterium]|nr:tyrosine-type recombinase/integrase [Clostridiales bacterium]
MEALVGKYVCFLERDKKVSENTLQSYKRDIVQYMDYLQEINICSITDTCSATVSSYLVHLQKNGKANSTISRNMASIRSFYQYMAEGCMVECDPTKGLESPKVDKKLPQILSAEEINLLLEQPKCDDLKGYRDKAMLELLYATGIRVSELINLNLTDLNLELCYIRCRKEEKERIIPIGSIAIAALKEYTLKARQHLIGREDEKALFVNVNGERLTRQGF